MVIAQQYTRYLGISEKAKNNQPTCEVTHLPSSRFCMLKQIFLVLTVQTQKGWQISGRVWAKVLGAIEHYNEQSYVDDSKEDRFTPVEVYIIFQQKRSDRIFSNVVPGRNNLRPYIYCCTNLM